MDPKPGSLHLLRLQAVWWNPIRHIPQGSGRGLDDWEKCNVSSFWWVLHSFLVKYCAWKTRIYGQHSSYKQSDCTLWRNHLAMTGGRLPWLPSPSHVVLAAAYVEASSAVPSWHLVTKAVLLLRFCRDLARVGQSFWASTFLSFLGVCRRKSQGSPGGETD